MPELHVLCSNMLQWVSGSVGLSVALEAVLQLRIVNNDLCSTSTLVNETTKFRGTERRQGQRY